MREPVKSDLREMTTTNRLMGTDPETVTTDNMTGLASTLIITRVTMASRVSTSSMIITEAREASEGVTTTGTIEAITEIIEAGVEAMTSTRDGREVVVVVEVTEKGEMVEMEIIGDKIEEVEDIITTGEITETMMRIPSQVILTEKIPDPLHMVRKSGLAATARSQTPEIILVSTITMTLGRRENLVQMKLMLVI